MVTKVLNYGAYYCVATIGVYPTMGGVDDTTSTDALLIFGKLIPCAIWRIFLEVSKIASEFG